MKRSGFRKKTYRERMERKKKLKSKPPKLPKLRPIKLLKKDLEKISHDFVRARDSIKGEIKKGFCCSCGLLAEGPLFQAGHYRTSGANGALLRYHPQNMHGQCRDCNCSRYNIENVKVEYAQFMYARYTSEELETMRQMKNYTINANRYFYTSMIDLYKAGDEREIVKFLNAYLC